MDSFAGYSFLRSLAVQLHTLVNVDHNYLIILMLMIVNLCIVDDDADDMYCG